ncbi:MAG: cysteine-rich VLP domain-containing protein, partial [Oscillospiraceae bacterium]|nr:cysteine-rich VLP domain-containing protein [Oscillospiraceae bacterium]
MSRELTREEKSAIRKLVFSLCANYDREYGCLPLDGSCYMLGKCWTGAYCRYFRDAVLPNDPVLEAALT